MTVKCCGRRGRYVYVFWIRGYIERYYSRGMTGEWEKNFRGVGIKFNVQKKGRYGSQDEEG